MMIRHATAIALLLVAFLAGAAELPVATDRNYAQEFVSANQSRYESYLSGLKRAWQTCCGDQEVTYPTVANASCERGDLFRTDDAWGISEQQRRPVDGGLKQLFDTDVYSYPVCVIRGEDGGCRRQVLRWALRARATGKLGSATAVVDKGRCALKVNAVKTSVAGYGRVGFQQPKPDMRVTRILGSDEMLTVRATIVGPSDMSAFTPIWSAKEVSIQGEQGFRKDGNLWVTEATLVARKAPVAVTFEIRRAGQVEFRDGFSIAGHPPPLDGLQFKQARRDVLLGETFDLFYPTDGTPPGLELLSEARLLNGQIVPNWAAPGIQDPKFVVAEPGIVEFSSPAGIDVGRHWLQPKRPGRTELRIDYPENLQMARARAFSEVYPVQVHELTLARVFGAQGVERYRLLARGPDPSRNRVNWGAGVTSFVKEAGYWIADVPADGVSRIAVVNPFGQTLAALATGQRAPLDAAVIHLLPPPLSNFSTFKNLPMPSSGVDMLGWAVSSGFCAQVSSSRLPQAMTRGKNAGEFKGLLDQARYLCQNKEQLQKNQEQIRRIIPEINRLTRELSKDGRELIGLEDDSVAVGASIKGLSIRFADRAYCRWSLKDGGASRMAFTYTPAEMIGESAGACFNRVTNLVEGFQPGMKVVVELIVEL